MEEICILYLFKKNLFPYKNSTPISFNLSIIYAKRHNRTHVWHLIRKKTNRFRPTRRAIHVIGNLHMPLRYEQTKQINKQIHILLSASVACNNNKEERIITYKYYLVLQPAHEMRSHCLWKLKLGQQNKCFR